MNARTIRRAAERKAAKLARKAEPTTAPNPTPISHAQQIANQVNAQLSTGPRTETGKQTSSRNALKTGLTGQTVLLPTDDLNAYQTLLENFTDTYQPATPGECALVQSLVNTTWRLRRIVPLEFAIYARGAAEFADQFEEVDPATRSQMIRLETYLKYEKSLRNLTTQESRLQRQLKKDTIALQQLQQDRHDQEAASKAAQVKLASKPQPAATNSKNGFEFANDPGTSATQPIDPADLLKTAA